jgi:hypothetical protein
MTVADRSMRSRSDVDQAMVESWVIEAYVAIESRLEQAEPNQRPTSTVTQRFGPVLRVLGALHLGFLVAALAIFLDYLILNFLFHMQP